MSPNPYATFEPVEFPSVQSVINPNCYAVVAPVVELVVSIRHPVPAFVQGRSDFQVGGSFAADDEIVVVEGKYVVFDIVHAARILRFLLAKGWDYQVLLLVEKLVVDEALRRRHC